MRFWRPAKASHGKKSPIRFGFILKREHPAISIFRSGRVGSPYGTFGMPRNTRLRQNSQRKTVSSTSHAGITSGETRTGENTFGNESALHVPVPRFGSGFAAVPAERLKPAARAAPGVEGDDSGKKRAQRMTGEVLAVEAQPRPPRLPHRGGFHPRSGSLRRAAVVVYDYCARNEPGLKPGKVRPQAPVGVVEVEREARCPSARRAPRRRERASGTTPWAARRGRASPERSEDASSGPSGHGEASGGGGRSLESVRRTRLTSARR